VITKIQETQPPQSFENWRPHADSAPIPLDRPWIVVGRSRDAQFYFPEDNRLSRFHCAFHLVGNNWHIEDLGSKNGTLVNNKVLLSSRQLQSGDRITAGNLMIVYYSGIDFAGPIVYISTMSAPS
jgi:pSer/pThr/pTyr-binding forkhead associated (FHA) protein